VGLEGKNGHGGVGSGGDGEIMKLFLAVFFGRKMFAALPVAVLSHQILRIKLNAKPYVCPEINHT